jgi:dCTP diphosphatase
MNDKITTVAQLKDKVEKFIKERNWEPYNEPKNLIMNIVAEAAELLEIFTWSLAHHDKDLLERKRTEVENEVADIAFALLSFCVANNIDLSKAMETKTELNAKKYPLKSN